MGLIPKVCMKCKYTLNAIDIGCNWENKCLPYAFEGSIYYQQVRHYNHNFYLFLKKKSEYFSVVINIMSKSCWLSFTLEPETFYYV